MPKCDFNKVTKQLSPVNVLHIFRTPFPKNTCRGLLLLHVRKAYFPEHLSVTVWNRSNQFSIYSSLQQLYIQCQRPGNLIKY